MGKSTELQRGSSARKIIFATLVETNTGFKILNNSNELTDTEKEQLTNLIKRYRELFLEKGK